MVLSSAGKTSMRIRSVTTHKTVFPLKRPEHFTYITSKLLTELLEQIV
jgi:hypothetical protein